MEISISLKTCILPNFNPFPNTVLILIWIRLREVDRSYTNHFIRCITVTEDSEKENHQYHLKAESK